MHVAYMLCCMGLAHSGLRETVFDDAVIDRYGRLQFKALWLALTMNLKQLSQTLGLSQTTVSRALNGYPEVAEATRLRVQQAAAAHNYRPTAIARPVASPRARVLGR